MLSGFWLVTRCEPRTAVSACRIASLGDAALLRGCATDGERPSFGGDREEQVLGADVLVLQPLGFLLGGVGDLRAGAPTAPAASRRARAAACPSSAAHRASRAPPDRRSSSGRSPGRCPRAARPASAAGARADLGMPFAIGELLRGEDRFLGFFGVLVDVHDACPVASSFRRQLFLSVSFLLSNFASAS